MRVGSQILIDRTTTASAAYVGVSASGTKEGDPNWSIEKITYDEDGKPISIQWAEGTDEEVLVWDNRVTYKYK